MGLFSSIGKSLLGLALDSTSGVRYVNNSEINSKIDEFVLRYKLLLKKAYNIDDKRKITMGFVTAAISVAKADGNFSNDEVLELLDFIEGSFGHELSREEALEFIQEINEAQLELEDVCRLSIELSRRYGESTIDTLRSFIEFIIYIDGKVHPKELEFLNNWNKTIEIMKSYH